MRYVIIEERVHANPALGIQEGVIVSVALLDRVAALACTLEGGYVFTMKPTNHSIRSARVVGKCQDIQHYLELGARIRIHDCQVHKSAARVIRELDRREA